MFETGILIGIDSTQAKAGSEQVKAELRGIANEARQTTQAVAQESGRSAEAMVAGAAKTRQATEALTKSVGLNRIGMLELQAAGINAFQALAAGIEPWRVAQTEATQVLGAFIQGGVLKLSAALIPLGIGLASAAAVLAPFAGFMINAWRESGRLAEAQTAVDAAFKRSKVSADDFTGSVTALARAQAEATRGAIAAAEAEVISQRAILEVRRQAANGPKGFFESLFSPAIAQISAHELFVNGRLVEGEKRILETMEAELSVLKAQTDERRKAVALLSPTGEQIDYGIAQRGGAAAKAALPEFDRQSSQHLKELKKLLDDVDTAMRQPRVKELSADYDLLAASQNALNHAVQTYIPAAEKQRMQDELAIRAISAKTPAEKALIAEQQKRLQLSGQVITTADAENQILLAGIAVRKQMTQAATDLVVATRAETDGTLAVAAAYAKSGDAILEAQAKAAAHKTFLQNRAVDEKALTDELIRQAKAERDLAYAQDQRAASQATQIAQMKASAAGILDVQGQHDAEMAIERQQKLNELTTKYRGDVEKINQLMGEFDRQQALNDQARFWTDSRKLAQSYADDVKNFLLDGLTGVYNNGKSIFENLWDAAEQGLKRFLVNAALTAAENAIIVPIIYQVVGSAPTSATGIAQPSGGGGVASSAQGFLGLGQQLAGGYGGGGGLFSTPLGTLFGSVGSTGASSSAAMAGPDAVGYGASTSTAAGFGGASLGGIFGGLGLGFGAGSLTHSIAGGNSQGSSIGTTVGTIGGTIIGAYFGVPMIGGAIGGALGSLVGGLFGNNRPSVGPQASGNARFTNGVFGFTGGGTDNGGQLSGISEALGQVSTAVNKIVTQLGATITGVSALQGYAGEVSLGNSNGSISAAIIGNQGATARRQSFGSDIGAAQEFLTIGALKATAQQGFLSGVGDAVATAIKNSVATKLEDFLSDIDFAKTLDDTAKGLADANDQFAQIARSAKTAALDTGQQLADLRARANQLGLTGQGEAAVQSVIQSLLDFTANPEQLDATEQALAAIQGHFDGLKDSLAQFGVTADQVEAGRQKALEDLVTGFNQGNQDAINAILDPLQQQLDSFDRLAEQRLQDAISIGADINLVTQRNELERQRIIEQYNQQTTQSLQDLYNRLKYGDLGGASPATTLAGTRGTFEALAAQASAGSAIALAQLPDAIQAFVSASRAFNASGSAFQADVTRAEEVLQNLGHFASGGEFTVGGNSTDNNLVMFRATRGERVTVSRDGQPANDQIGRAQLTQLITLTQEVQQQGANMAAMRADIAKLASYQRRQSNR